MGDGLCQNLLSILTYSIFLMVTCQTHYFRMLKREVGNEMLFSRLKRVTAHPDCKAPGWAQSPILHISMIPQNLGMTRNKFKPSNRSTVTLNIHAQNSSSLYVAFKDWLTVTAGGQQINLLQGWNTLYDFCPELQSGWINASYRKSEPVCRLDWTDLTENHTVYDGHKLQLFASKTEDIKHVM